MNKLIRYYNQNRREIWRIIIIIVFAIIIIQFINSVYENAQKEKRNNKKQEILSEEVKEKNEPMVQGSIGSNTKKEKFAYLIEQFLKYCTNNQPAEAYKLLSNDCKEKLYPTEKAFEASYYNIKFSKNKTYDFQLWSAVDRTYIYLVKIYDNMLASGKVSNEKYIKDYYSVIQENGDYKLSISEYVKKIDYNTSEDDTGDDGNSIMFSGAEDIKISVLNKDCYIDYEIYHILVVNSSEQNILLDTISKGDTIVVVDEKGNEFDAMTVEFNEEDLIIEKGESEFLDIKFARSYVSNIQTEEIKFKNIVKNYDDYAENRGIYKDFTQIDIELK